MKAEWKKALKVSLQQIVFVIIAFAAMVLVSYFYVSRIVREQMQVIGEETMNTIETAVEASLTEAQLGFANVAQTVETMAANGDDNKSVLRFLRSENSYFAGDSTPLPDFMKLYGYLRDEFLDGSGWVPPDTYQPTTRPWYIGAMNHRPGIFFSEPYLDAETGSMCISFSQTVLDKNGDSVGVVAIDLKLSRISDYVTNQNIANSGYGVLLSDTYNFTTHKNPDLVGLPMEDAGDGYARLAGMLQQGETVSAERFEDADGTDSVAFFRTILNNWHIGVVIPRAAYYNPIYQMAFVLGAMGFVLMLALCAMLVRLSAQKLRADEESLSKSNFLARMSHEMRTPMNAIIGMTGIAKKADDSEKVDECLDKIDSAANHLLGVINDVLDMSKIEAGKLELSPEDFAVSDLLEQVRVVSGFKMDEQHQAFTITVEDDVPATIVADRQRLAQVITNFLSNATKFTPEGGHISLAVRQLYTVPDGRHMLQMEVSDNGIGIAPENIDRLFHSFEQADGSISRKYGGTGLGLAISKKIIEMMDGDVHVDSALGKGTRFIFTFKAAAGTAQQSAPAGTPAAEANEADIINIFAGEHALLAEDVEINREIVQTMLEETGITFDCAQNGIEAVALFKQNPEKYGIIFMDIQMPEMDGYEATRAIRAMDAPSAKTVPIVALTANVFREDIERCLAAGMDTHLGKPIEMDDILAKMRRYLLDGETHTAES